MAVLLFYILQNVPLSLTAFLKISEPLTKCHGRGQISVVRTTAMLVY